MEIFDSKIEYPEFTKEMKDEYTILVPSMLPVHFKILSKLFKENGYNIEVYEADSQAALGEALKSVHNDMCYPALIVIGQVLHALKSGKYDINKTALIMSQTGGGCRASNYIHLLRKALRDNEMGFVPVISINASGLEKHSGFKITPAFMSKLIYAVYYGDLLMIIANQCRPYEVNEGETEKVMDEVVEDILKEFKSVGYLKSKKIYKHILDRFAKIKRTKEEKVKVGIVGEIYMKYSPLGNNNLEQFLLDEGCEVVMSGVCDFFLYCLSEGAIDRRLYGMNKLTNLGKDQVYNLAKKMQKTMINVVKEHGVFRAPKAFDEVKGLINGYISDGVKMGEGWLMTAEMLELIDSGVNNVVCAQPFGCLPNHIVGRGMNRKIMDNHPGANIVTVDYDPASTKVNQENRIKLMLSNAKLVNFLKEGSEY
ncbi:MAG: 2-hydroxyglutaryl-CoA dehydratase [Sarcina sp.]